jgi:PEP-CTERM motif-containing protein
VLSAGGSYWLLQTVFSNELFTAYGVPLPSNGKIAVTQSGTLANSIAADVTGERVLANQYWAAFNNITTSAVPEPSSWMMMLLGFAGLGFAGYRKGKSQSLLTPATSPAPACQQDQPRDQGEGNHACVQLEPSARLVDPTEPGRRSRFAGPGQREGDQRVVRRAARLAMAAGGDHDILPSLPLIGRWRRIARRRQAAGPELGAGLRIECAKIIVHGGADEDQPARRGERPAERRRAGSQG